jgi:localization factor PodJL
MKFGVPWGVKGIRPEARETAKEAARRSGMSLEDWLNSVILLQATQQGLPTPAPGDADVHGEDLATVHQRLDDLTRRIEQMTHSGPAAYAPRRDRSDPDQFGGAPQTAAPPLAPAMPQPTVQLPPGLDRAVAEISARRRTLNGEPAPARPQPQAPEPAPEPVVDSGPVVAPAIMTAIAAQTPTPLRTPLPAQDLSGLEDQLRHITDQIETLRRPDIEGAINALREELGEIGRALNAAMPRRAIESIEKQIHALATRINEGRQAGVDQHALAGIEHGLAEVRGALHGLTPAENLVGFNEAVTGLASKIDEIIAQNDPATFQRLTSTVTTLREMVGHIASNETVSQLAAEVQALSAKIDQLAHATSSSDALIDLDHRVTALADVLAEREQTGNAMSPRLEALVQSLSGKIDMLQSSRGDSVVSPQLESLFHSLADKIDQIQSSRGDNIAISHLEDRIVNLVAKLDASESRLDQLEAIERGLSDLLVHIEDIKAKNPAEELRADAAPAVDELKHNMVRTQDALESVHGTLGLVVERLAMIEKEFRGEGRAQPPTEDAPAPPVDKLAVHAVSEAPEPAPMPPATPMQLPEPPPIPPATALQVPEPPLQLTSEPPAPSPAPAPSPRRRTATSLPINREPSADQPLEPGSGPPQFSARIAASEAALGGAGPAATAAPGSKSNFIAAARRAAQAATQQLPTASAPRGEPVPELENSGQPSLRGKIMTRVKTLFIAASIIAIVVGGFQIAGNVLRFGSAPKNEAPKSGQAETGKAEPAKTDTAKTDTAVRDVTPKAEPSRTAKPPEFSAVAPLTMPTGTATPPLMPPPGINAATQQVPSLLSPPALSTPPVPGAKTPAAKDDVTGSIPEAAAALQAGQSGEATPPEQEKLPLAIGGPRLRSAALSGDAAAAYEVAVRLAEGRGVPVNLEEAAHWFARAASGGLAPAQFRYASMLEKGQGVKKDKALARQLYLAAAAQGHAKAMHNLAVLYAQGVDGKPDYGAAVKWFRRAAQRGVADSQYNLGVLTARGFGTEKNFAESYKWFALAAAQGDQESTKKRDEIATHLDATALAAAQQAVKAFKVKPQPKTATAVPKPQGGWDNAAAAPRSPPKAKAQPQTHQPSHAPLSLGSFTIGKR